MKILLKIFCCFIVSSVSIDAFWILRRRSSPNIKTRSTNSARRKATSTSGSWRKSRYTSNILATSYKDSTISSINQQGSSHIGTIISKSKEKRVTITSRSIISGTSSILNQTCWSKSQQSCLFSEKSNWHASFPSTQQSQAVTKIGVKSKLQSQITATVGVKESLLKSTLSLTQTSRSITTTSMIAPTNLESKQVNSSSIQASLFEIHSIHPSRIMSTSITSSMSIHFVTGTVELESKQSKQSSTDTSLEIRSIQPSRSMSVSATSSMSICFDTGTVEFNVTLKGKLSKNQISKKFLEIICVEVNQICFNIKDDQCLRSRLNEDRISLSDLRIAGKHIPNKDSAVIKIAIDATNGTCRSTFETCAEKSMLTSKRLKNVLGVYSITVCRSSGNCTSMSLNNDKTDVTSTDDGSAWWTSKRTSAIAVGVVMLALLILVAILYTRKKRMLRIHSETKLKKPKKNMEIATSTSKC